jgi:dihydrolipoamide dehydrogenase
LTKIMEEGGVHIIRGRGRLAGRKRVIVSSTDGGVNTTVARHAVVLSTGSTSTIPDVPGLLPCRAIYKQDLGLAAMLLAQRMCLIGLQLWEME